MRFLPIVFFLMTAAACAQIYTTAPLDSAAKVHDINFEGCHFKVTDLFNGRIALTERSRPVSVNYDGPLYQKGLEKNNLWIQMWCEKSSDELFRDCAISLKDGRLNTTNTKGESEEVVRQLNQKRVALKGKNWTGAGYTEDQINGDEDRRTRSFHFCAVKGEKTIYGRIESVAWLNNLKESAMPNIIKLLESIEFIDDATAPVSAVTDKH